VKFGRDPARRLKPGELDSPASGPDARSGAELSSQVQGLDQRVDALEQRCRELADAVAERDATIAQLKVDQVATAKRLQEAVEQSDKAAIGLLQRIEAVRIRVFGPAVAA
jgi:uncharacterized protein YoxC